MIFAMEAVKHVYEVRPHSDHRGVDLISDALPFGRFWYTKPNDAVELYDLLFFLTRMPKFVGVKVVGNN